jgi:hypothetical protein
VAKARGGDAAPRQHEAQHDVEASREAPAGAAFGPRRPCRLYRRRAAPARQSSRRRHARSRTSSPAPTTPPGRLLGPRRRSRQLPANAQPSRPNRPAKPAAAGQT